MTPVVTALSKDFLEKTAGTGYVPGKEGDGGLRGEIGSQGVCSRSPPGACVL